MTCYLLSIVKDDLNVINILFEKQIDLSKRTLKKMSLSPFFFSVIYSCANPTCLKPLFFENIQCSGREDDCSFFYKTKKIKVISTYIEIYTMGYTVNELWKSDL